jgi:hypothetical protein
MRSSVDARFTAMRVKAAQRRAEKDMRKAEHHADLASRTRRTRSTRPPDVVDQADDAEVDEVIARIADDFALNT